MRFFIDIILDVVAEFAFMVIDDDLGRSAADGVQRAGFERMAAEVCLGTVGEEFAGLRPSSTSQITVLSYWFG